MKKIIILALAVFSTAVFAQETKPDTSTPEKKNIVFDGGFDTVKRMGTSRHFGYYKDGVFYGWTIASTPIKDINNVELDEKVFVSAPNSMKMEINKDKNPITLNQSLHYYKQKLQPDKQYKISCMIKLENVTPNGAVLNLVYGPNNLWSQWLTGTSDWKKLEFTIKAKPDADKIKNLDLNIRFYGTGTIWVDDVCVEQL